MSVVHVFTDDYHTGLIRGSPTMTLSPGEGEPGFLFYIPPVNKGVNLLASRADDLSSRITLSHPLPEQGLYREAESGVWRCP